MHFKLHCSAVVNSAGDGDDLPCMLCPQLNIISLLLNYCLNYSYKYDPSKALDEPLQVGDVIIYYDTVFGCRPSGE